MKKIGIIGVLVILGMLVSTSLLGGQVAAEEAEEIEVIITQEGITEEVLVTFEGGGWADPLQYLSGAGMTFDGGWRTYDCDGEIENNPSGSGIALWWREGSDYTWKDIYFDLPVKKVSLFISSMVDYSLEAYNEGGNVIAYNSAPSNTDYRFNVWDQISMEVEDFVITQVRIHGYAFRTLIDDLRIYRVVTIDVPVDIKPGSDPNSINLDAQGNVPVAIFSTTDFDAATIDSATVTLAGAAVKLKGKSEAPQASLKDVNGDGLIDLLVHIVIDGLELELGSTEAELIGYTYEGARVYGMDAVNIVPA